MVRRSFNAKSLTKGFTDLFNLPSILHPDIYNVTEKQAVDTFKFHNRVGRGQGGSGQGGVWGMCDAGGLGGPGLKSVTL